MKLLLNPMDLANEFDRLCDDYTHYYWAVAWAGNDFDALGKLKGHQKKIAKLIVGLHFYQTHPAFIEEFIDHRGVRFIMQPNGTYHPKIYLFEDDADNWELLIGSANFTKTAFTQNCEANLLISSKDKTDISIQEVYQWISDKWAEGKMYTRKELKRYKEIYETTKRKRDNLSTPFHKEFATKIDMYFWEEYVYQLRQMHENELTGRLMVLDMAQELFKEYSSLRNMSLLDRKRIAGLINKKSKNEDDLFWRWFGAMTGSGTFHNHINQNEQIISDALDFIPLTGEVSRSDYENYIRRFKQVESDNPIGTATRLLAMKRPDTFVCICGGNREKLCERLGITPSTLNVDTYWEVIVERIRGTFWYKDSCEKDEQDAKLKNYQVAMLDMIFYKGDL